MFSDISDDGLESHDLLMKGRLAGDIGSVGLLTPSCKFLLPFFGPFLCFRVSHMVPARPSFCRDVEKSEQLEPCDSANVLLIMDRCPFPLREKLVYVFILMV